jgi:hypothetical protein
LGAPSFPKVCRAQGDSASCKGLRSDVTFAHCCTTLLQGTEYKRAIGLNYL